jgi:hypothetical protein
MLPAWHGRCADLNSVRHHGKATRAIRAIVLWTITMITTSIGGATHANEDTLTLTVGPERQVYHLGGPILITVGLQNTGRMPVTVNKRLELSRPELQLQIEDEQGQKARWLPPVPPPPLTASDFVDLAAGQSLTAPIEIGRHLSSPLRPGRYTAMATYSNSDRGAAFGLRAWTGTVTSHAISFEIRERSV